MFFFKLLSLILGLLTKQSGVASTHLMLSYNRHLYKSRAIAVKLCHKSLPIILILIQVLVAFLAIRDGKIAGTAGD